MGSGRESRSENASSSSDVWPGTKRRSPRKLLQHPPLSESQEIFDRNQRRRSPLASVFEYKESTMNNSRPLKSIRLQLARSRQHPEGSPNHGYQFVAPLDAEGHIDPEGWKSHRDQCRVRRFWQGEDDQIGRLVHKPGGAEHARW